MADLIVRQYKTSEKTREQNRQGVQRYRKTPKGIAARSRANYTRRQKMIAEGICTYCQKKPPESGYRACRPCLDNVAQRTRKRRDRLIQELKCIRRGKRRCLPAMEGRTESFCETCYFRNAAGNRMGNVKAWDVIRNKFYAQESRCAYTGEAITLGLNDSLDHVLPVSRYPELRGDPNNVVWVTRKVNCMKWDSTRDEFLATALAVVRYNHLS